MGQAMGFWVSVFSDHACRRIRVGLGERHLGLAREWADRYWALVPGLYSGKGLGSDWAYKPGLDPMDKTGSRDKK